MKKINVLKHKICVNFCFKLFNKKNYKLEFMFWSLLWIIMHNMFLYSFNFIIKISNIQIIRFTQCMHGFVWPNCKSYKKKQTKYWNRKPQFLSKWNTFNLDCTISCLMQVLKCITCVRNERHDFIENLSSRFLLNKTC